MDTNTILLICSIAIPIVVGLVTFFITYAVRGKTIEEARKEALEAKETIKEILNFYDPEKPYCDTSFETYDLIAEHPYSYCLEKDEKELIFEGLPEDEIQELELTIAGYEADMNVDYILHTSLTAWRVYYGTPTEIVPEI